MPTPAVIHASARESGFVVPFLQIGCTVQRPADAARPIEDYYATMLELASMADDHGFDLARFGEHHDADDAYTPSPITWAAAVAGRTQQIRLQPTVLTPLYDPLRLAEDLAVLDLASGGRTAPVLAIGYREEEFAMFGRQLSERVAAIEETVLVLRKAWSGERFEYRGRSVRIAPVPCQRPRVPISIGGGVPASARRAARLGEDFRPASGDPAVYEVYRDELRKLGRPDPGPAPRMGPTFVHVTEDPDAAWPLVGPRLLASVQLMGSWTKKAFGASRPNMPLLESIEQLKADRRFRVVTPDECVQILRDLGPDGAFSISPMLGGIDPELALASMDLFCSKVLPRAAQSQG